MACNLNRNLHWESTAWDELGTGRADKRRQSVHRLHQTDNETPQHFQNIRFADLLIRLRSHWCRAVGPEKETRALRESETVPPATPVDLCKWLAQFSRDPAQLPLGSPAVLQGVDQALDAPAASDTADCFCAANASNQTRSARPGR